ncbi:MAG: hypothetical protein KF775_04200 [Cyclobacteriaceae bacterium]|nr:hypothetical protein [Cyclobacteriaceae bacterium]
MKRIALLSAALLGLLIVFVFQRFNYAHTWNSIVPQVLEFNTPNQQFIFNRTVRLVINDCLCIILIWQLFNKPFYLRISFIIFLIELFVVLPIYFFLKLSLEGASEISSPLLSHIHRMIVNPLLMFLLIIGFIYQSRISKI